MVTDNEARARLLRILDDAHTFEELDEGITAEHRARTHALFGTVLRFIAEGDASDLDAVLQERLAQVLSRFVESTRALELAGILERGDEPQA